MFTQVMMSVAGMDLPLGKSSKDQLLRERVYNIIAPYCMSKEDMEEVEAFSERERNLWLESFTNTQKGLIFTSLFSNAKDWFRQKYFPSGGAYPASTYANLIGLPPGKSILERLDLK